ncbi:hypothetical protein EDC18_101308 [Natranaerovirga pectinivora]|uniref:Short-subunit dehydrogenase n=1 Tax=Natranaerovirga pectinivora TaxID=682400 RepID=A0A4R3MQ65_9FIRM|nr:SDR family NAD(P)-dependent oxidoreductase [Natranaerovirga pectinivora]TCT17012.1 hypothetical protein EDC18_101308 [Natranaerovirga pectinivora]
MKIAVITGASSGLGNEFAKQISKKVKGIDELWLIARREDKLMALKESIKNVNCRVIPLDLTDRNTFTVYENLLKEHSPKICMLINSAGFGKMGSFDEIDINDQLEMVDLNIKSLLKMTHASMPYLIKNGRVIQIASSAGFMPQPSFNTYAATKSFVISFSRALNQELKERGIKVTAVCPGPVETEFFDVAGGEVSMSIKKLAMAKADVVVKKALDDSIKGKEISVYGPLMNVFRVMAKVLPHRLILSHIKYYNK